MKYSFVKLVFLYLIVLISCQNSKKKENNSQEKDIVIEHNILKKDYSKTNEEALKFCKKNNFNEDFYFLIDYSIHSGKNRFFVYNFKEEKNEYEKLVLHGSCDVFEDNPKKFENVKFSNKLDSHCSAKGKYKVGRRDGSGWGVGFKYWLIGLEKSNSNSEKRITVLHSWDEIADEEIYPQYSALSWGCPTVSNNFLKILDKKLKDAKKPVLLWIIN